MTRWLSATLTRIAMVAMLLAFAPVAQAQTESASFASVRLTETLVRNYIAFRHDLAALGQRLDAAAAGRPDPALRSKLDDIARKNGFAKFDEAEDVSVMIDLLMAGIDPETGVYNDVGAAIDREIDEILSQPDIPQAERESMLKVHREARNIVPRMPHKKENIEIVRKFRRDIEKAIQAIQ